MSTDIDRLRADLASLKEARRLGVRRTMFRNGEDQRETEFKSDAEMASAIWDMEREIAQLESAPASRNVVIRSSKGW